MLVWCQDKVPVLMVQVGGCSYGEALEHARHAENIGKSSNPPASMR